VSALRGWKRRDSAHAQDPDAVKSFNRRARRSGR
jgi:hypothetical protein